MLLFFGFDVGWIYGILIKIVQWLAKPLWSKSTAITGSIAFIFETINNPQGAINTFMNNTIDITVGNLPSTPEQYKIGTLVSTIANNMPFGGAYVVDIFQSISAITVIYLGFKSVKSLPFT